MLKFHFILATFCLFSYFLALLDYGHCWTFSLPHHRLFGQHYYELRGGGKGNEGKELANKAEEAAASDEIIWPINKVIMEDDMENDGGGAIATADASSASAPFLRISGSPWQRFKLVKNI